MAASAAVRAPVLEQPPPTEWPNPEEEERRRIDEENNRRLAGMSAEEIERERNELLGRLDPKLVAAIMKRGKKEEGAPKEEEASKGEKPQVKAEGSKKPLEETPEAKAYYATIPKKKAEEEKSAAEKAFDAIPAIRKGPGKKGFVEATDEPYDPDNAAPKIYDESLFPPTSTFHFPKAPQPAGPDLDPSDPNFLQNLHDKFFPDLPADPSKLAWMAPVTDREEVEYSPNQTDFSPAALRFDFRGDLLPPRKSKELPVFLGLHHHADAPSAAGYTIPELARLARSTFPSQRCIAMQLLGRVLYKLGTGVYKVEAIEEGLWKCMEAGRVLETLEEAAAMKGGHMSVKAYATEALWYVHHLCSRSTSTHSFSRLWQKGGGKRPGEPKEGELPAVAEES